MIKNCFSDAYIVEQTGYSAGGDIVIYVLDHDHIISYHHHHHGWDDVDNDDNYSFGICEALLHKRGRNVFTVFLLYSLKVKILISFVNKGDCVSPVIPPL